MFLYAVVSMIMYYINTFQQFFVLDLEKNQNTSTKVVQDTVGGKNGFCDNFY